MSDVLVYTFRTCPFIDELKKFGEVLVLDKLKADLKQLCERIGSERPSLVLGIAKQESSESCCEAVALNEFHGKKVSQEGRDRLHLDVIDSFAVSRKGTTSFCNYAAYTVQEFLEKEGLQVKHSFVHMKESDLPLLEFS